MHKYGDSLKDLGISIEILTLKEIAELRTQAAGSLAAATRIEARLSGTVYLFHALIGRQRKGRISKMDG